MPIDPVHRREMAALLPNLLAFATAMTGCPARAEGLVRGAILRALDDPAGIAPGSSLRAWLLTVLRERIHTEGAVPDTGDHASGFQDIQEAISMLSPEQRESLLLVTAEGLGYEDAARICRTDAATIRRHVLVGSARLNEILGPMAWHDAGRSDAPAGHLSPGSAP